MTSKHIIENKIACHQCDTLLDKPNISENQKALCPCCGSELFTCKVDHINRTIAVSLAGLLLFLPSILLPIVGIAAAGLYNEASLLNCIELLINSEFYVLTFSIFLFTIAIPVVRLISALYISLRIKYQKLSPSLLIFFRSYHTLDCWAMTHVFFMGVVVSMYKLMSLADMSVGGGLLSLLGLLICSTLVSVTMDSHDIWDTLEGSLEQ